MRRRRNRFQIIHFGAVLVVAVTVATALLMAGCNTVRGVGQDIQAASDTVERAMY